MKNILIAIAIVFLSVTTTHAATASVVAPRTAATGNQISIDVMVDPEKESVNTFEFTVQYPSTLLSFSGYNAKDSIISLWLETPKEKEKGSVQFSGVIPGGIERLYDPEHPDNHAIRIARLLFTATNAGSGEVSIKKTTILRNDGIGSPVAVTTSSAGITIDPGTVSEGNKDTTPPEPFQILVSDGSMFGKTPRLAIFHTNDEYGIDHYEGKVGAGSFKRIESPFALPYRLFSYNLTVRAYDFSGNYIDEEITVPGDSPSAVIPLIFVILLLGLYLYFRRSRYEKV